MKKILSLVMALAMVLGCFAMAETTSILDADMDELLVLDRESSLNDWEGEWVLVAAYITADFAEEYDVEQSGLLAVPENAATLTITALKDATANDKELGTMVDVASYIHDHTYDLSGELTFSDTSSCAQLARVELPEASWSLQGEQLVIGRNCSAAGLAHCVERDVHTLNQQCLPQ